MQAQIVVAICIIFSIVSITTAYGYTINGTMEVSDGYREAAINPSTSTLYVPGDDFSIVNVTSLKIIKALYIEESFSNAIVNEKTNLTYYFDSNIKGGHLHVLDASNRIIRNITIGLANFDPILVLNPKTNLIYFEYGDILVNATSNTVVGKMPFTVPLYDMAIDPMTNKIYSTSVDGRIQVYNGTTNKLIEILKISNSTLGFYPPHIIGIFPSAKLLYVVNTPYGPIRPCIPAFVLTINLTKGNIIANTTIFSPRSFAVNENTGKVYIGSGDCNRLTAMDGYSGKVLYTFDGYWQAVVNPKTNIVYAIAAHPFYVGKDNVEAIYDPEKVPEFPLSALSAITGIIGLVLVISRIQRMRRSKGF